MFRIWVTTRPALFPNPFSPRSKSYSNICGQKASTSCLPKSYLMFRDRMNIRRKPDHPTLKICFWNGGSGSFSLSAVPFRGNKLPLDIGALESSHWSRRERHKTEPHRVPFCNVFSRPLLLLTPTVYPFVIPPEKKGFFYISWRWGRCRGRNALFYQRRGCGVICVMGSL